MKKKVSSILLFIIVCAVAALAIAFLRPYKPTSFVVDGDIFSATVEDGATLILDLDNDSNGKEWSIIQTPGHSQCFVKDYVTVTENVTEFHIIATDDGKDVMLFQCVSDDGTKEKYELALSVSRHKKSYLQIDSVSFVRTENGIESRTDVDETKTDTDRAEEYIQDEDGSRTYMNRTYPYRLMLTGTLPNAAVDSFYVVLTDDEDITFEDASDFLLSSTRDPGEENRFVIVNLGVYTPECEVESAKVMVSAVEAAPTRVTICFDQYDNTVKSDLLTGEYFVLEKKDKDQWIQLEPVVENAAFTDIGIMLQKGVITQKTFDWEWLYGRQEPGQYRIWVQVVDDTIHEAAAEFMITE